MISKFIILTHYDTFLQVMEVVNGDALVVKTSEGQLQKIFFSSLRPPRSVMFMVKLVFCIDVISCCYF